MAKHWEQLSLVEIEDIKATLKKQREADQIESLMCEELDKCQQKTQPQPQNQEIKASGKEDEPVTKQ